MGFIRSNKGEIINIDEGGPWRKDLLRQEVFLDKWITKHSERIDRHIKYHETILGDLEQRINCMKKIFVELRKLETEGGLDLKKEDPSKQEVVGGFKGFTEIPNDGHE